MQKFFAAAACVLLSVGPWAQAAGELAVTDDAGQTVHLPVAARRIITLSPHATELIYAVDAGSSLVAVSEASDVPAAAALLPTVGGASGMDLERIVALRPDLVIAWTSGNGRGQLEALTRAGLQVFRSDPKTTEQIATSLERLGILTGHAKTSQKKAQALRQQMADLRATFGTRQPVSVFYQVWQQPLYTLGGPTLTSELIRTCGGENVFGQLDAVAPIVSIEAVAVRNPQVIVTSPERVAEVESFWRAHGPLKAITGHHVIGIDSELLTRATPRVAQGATLLCSALETARQDAPNSP